MTDAALIGIDNGTSAVKATLFDSAGAVLAEFSEAYLTRRPKPGHVEQDAECWMQLAGQAQRHPASAVQTGLRIGAALQPRWSNSAARVS